MKNVLLVIRWVVGLLFIFSGLIKANDPLGLSYKMQEFFEVWSLHGFNDYTLTLSLVMNVFEVLAGVAVIIGWRMKLFSWLLLLLIVFFTFLTGYALFSGKIKTCGCFGDCLPLTALQSFLKDIFLLILILVLFIFHKRIVSAVPQVTAMMLLLLVVMGTAAGQIYVLKHLPVVDCLPYKTGNNILEEMKTPPNAIPDSLSIIFQYKKNGKEVSFDQAHFPDDFDSTYEYIDRRDVVVRKGNGLQPKILDFSLQTLSGADTTQAIFATRGNYMLAMIKDMVAYPYWKKDFEEIRSAADQKHLPVIIVTGDAAKSQLAFPGLPIVTCDVTVIKTAARATPTFLIMQGATIISKNSFADADKVKKAIDQLK
jgi:uncharacterized membrane protein YphA (DoxX/SURF4 family)